MELLELRLRNFKGIQNFVFTPDGQNISIFGDNATGKTTIEDAYQWLLFDKDSEGKSNFNIKTLDENNEPIHGLEHEVEGVFMVDGKRLSLKKVYKEVWTQKRGSMNKEFSGHTTDYYIDDVPLNKKNEYLGTIASIADESTFKLLANPLFFNTQLHWKKRREILLEVCGDVTDTDVISSDTKLSKLPEILGSRTTEKHKDYIKSRMKKINEEIEKIPVRIDEVQRGLPDISNIKINFLEKELEHLKGFLADKEDELIRINSGNEVMELRKRKTEIETQIIDIKNEHNKGAVEKLDQLRKQVSKLNSEIWDSQSRIKSLNTAIEEYRQKLNADEEAVKALRETWFKVDAEKFIKPDVATSCYACGHALPEEQIEAAITKAEESFNLDKSKRLESINTEGANLNNRIKSHQQNIEELTIKVRGHEEKLSLTRAEIDKLIKDIQGLEQQETCVPPALIELEKQKEEIDAKIADVMERKAAVKEVVVNEISSIKSSIAEIEKDFTRIETSADGLFRIDQLKAEEKELAKEYEKLQSELFLVEEFIKTKVRLLEEKINSKFKLARFKMFNVQVNGGIEETCETMVNGVPFSDLNNAMRINVGLDIINALSEHYNFTAPIFVDNREAVTKLIETRGQVISLVVSEPDKKLRVEYGDSNLRKVVG